MPWILVDVDETQGKFHIQTLQLMAIDSCNEHKLYFPASLYWKWRVTRWHSLKHAVWYPHWNVHRGFTLCPNAITFVTFIVQELLKVMNSLCVAGITVSSVFPRRISEKTGQDRHFIFLHWFIPVNTGTVTYDVLDTADGAGPSLVKMNNFMHFLQGDTNAADFIITNWYWMEVNGTKSQ